MLKYFAGFFALPSNRSNEYYRDYYLDVNGDKKFDFLDAIAQQRKVLFAANVKTYGFV